MFSHEVEASFLHLLEVPFRVETIRLGDENAVLINGTVSHELECDQQWDADITPVLAHHRDLADVEERGRLLYVEDSTVILPTCRSSYLRRKDGLVGLGAGTVVDGYGLYRADLSGQPIVALGCSLVAAVLLVQALEESRWRVS
ncbi:hypothetical protein HT576_20680 [Haloterrigena sp. SYSU A121-1]|uniref:Uncharacterized protein n=1 Tax=Haloterrigena gelatinilytica TaxID=2741724 RepID=A0A8J8KJI9_9EURY|nr:hypothetical protein [Haloterrigena gelatinilytica]NUB93419.1 hypothetical protein [Haloterrigena gelatinilytica]